MKQEHMPMLMQTGCFVEYKFFRLLEQDDTDGPTFCAQYYCNTRADYDRYIDDFAAKMRAETLGLWGNKLVAFRSLMEQK
jgi:hypothetical protein